MSDRWSKQNANNKATKAIKTSEEETGYIPLNKIRTF